MEYTYADIEKLISDRGLDTKIKSVFGDDTTILYRDIEENRTRDYFLNKYFTADTLYYIEKIKDTNPSRIVHIGCGSNIFKKIYGDLIYGVDVDHPEADELNIWDSQFLIDNYQKFDSAMSICSLQPSLGMLESTISDFISVLSPMGIGYLSFSSTILINFTPSSELEGVQSDEEELLGLSAVYESAFPEGTNNKVMLKTFIDNVVYKFKDNIIEYSNLMDDETVVSTAMDGDIRILLKKI